MVSSAPLSPFYDNIIANALQPSKLAAASRLPSKLFAETFTVGDCQGSDKFRH